MQPEHLLDLSKVHTSIHMGAVTVAIADVPDHVRVQGLREANDLIGALLLAEEDKLNARHFEMGLPFIEWPAGVELPGGSE